MTEMSAPSLPDENVHSILSFSLPRRNAQVWEWTGILGQTCKRFRRMSRDFAPTVIYLDDFSQYWPVMWLWPIDARAKFLQSVIKHRWMAERITELHVNSRSVLRPQSDAPDGYFEANIKILEALRILLTTTNSLPKVKVLDINAQCDSLFQGYELVDRDFLQSMPSALPSLEHLCLSNCVNNSSSEASSEPLRKRLRTLLTSLLTPLWSRSISPTELKAFFESLQTPLQSLSISHVNWMTDAHIAAFLPIIGCHLTRLELIECTKYCYDGGGYTDDIVHLTDTSAAVIAKECSKLESFAFVRTDVTNAGLEKVLRRNPNISTLDLSGSICQLWSSHLDPQAVNIITRYLPRLKELRNYNGSRDNAWLTDDGLISLIDAQMSHLKGAGIYLELLGISDEKYLTKRSLDYALKNGLNCIEIEQKQCADLFRSLEEKGRKGVDFVEPSYYFYVDGSECNNYLFT